MDDLIETAREMMYRDLFTAEEWHDRNQDIATIRGYDRVRLSAEQALTRIRDKKLYRPFRTLKEFCKAMFGWSDRRTEQIIAAERIVSALPEPERTKIRTERQARELGKSPEDQRPEIVNLADRVYAKDGKITSEDIKAAAAKLATRPADCLDHAIPEGTAQRYWARIHEWKTILHMIHVAQLSVEELSPNDPMWYEATVQNIGNKLKEAYHSFKAAIPAYVCPYCQGVDMGAKACSSCKGKGVVGQYIWERSCRELNRMREAECRRITKT